MNTIQQPRPIVICEASGCGKKLLRDYAYSYAGAMATTGHAHVGAFMCDCNGGSGQHWGCSAEHALEAAIQCHREHLHPRLLAAHQEKNAAGLPWYSKEDEENFRNNPNFHIVGNS